jgi:hypothetical protein
VKIGLLDIADAVLRPEAGEEPEEDNLSSKLLAQCVESLADTLRHIGRHHPLDCGELAKSTLARWGISP